MIDTSFFVIQIVGLITIVFWAHRNELCTAITGQKGLLAMKVVKGQEGVEASAGPSAETTAAPGPVRRSPPPRQRFLSS